MYLIESYCSSPIYITYPKPVGYVQTLKQAKAICELKNKKQRATSTDMPNSRS